MHAVAEDAVENDAENNTNMHPLTHLKDGPLEIIEDTEAKEK